METTAPPPDFNPWTQPVTLFNSDGSNFTISMADLNDYRIYSGRLAINYGTQIGATLLLLLVLLLLTRSEKRRSSIFIINSLCLTVNTIRCILLSCYVTSTIQNPYTLFSGDYSQITKADYATNATTDVFTLLVFVLIMISLSMQVWVVCITTVPVQRYIIMATTTIMALIATGYKAAFIILNIRATLGVELLLPFKKVVDASYITQAISIWLFSCVFTYKLGYAIFQRRKLKMPQFGPMQVVFIMGCQTMLIPAIFSCLQFQQRVPELGAQVLTVVCIFLPLSAIWAGIVNETAVPTRGPLIHNEFYRSIPNSTYGSSASRTMVEKSRQVSVCTCAMKGKGVDCTGTSPTTLRQKSVVEMENKEGMHIARDFGFSRGDAADQV